MNKAHITNMPAGSGTGSQAANRAQKEVDPSAGHWLIGGVHHE